MTDKYQMKDGNFVLFKNQSKKTEKHPDLSGPIMINGVEHWFNAWTKEGKKGKFISGQIGDPKKQGFTPRGNDEMPRSSGIQDDEIPF